MTTARLNRFYVPEFVAEGRQRFAEGTPAAGMDRNGRAVNIMDGRELQLGEGLSEAAFFSRHSFVLLPHASAVSDWDRDSAAIYLPEIDQVIRERLFPGQRIEIQQGPNVLRRGRATQTPVYAEGVHSDGGLDLEDYIHNMGAFTTNEAAQLWRALYERQDVAGMVWIDFWRTTNMAGPLEHMPLALCDPTSVAACDIIPIAMTGIAPSARESHHLSLRFNAEQRWYYYPRMTTEELLSFKLAEFWKIPEPFRNCFHSAFDNPDMPCGAEERQSCEHRVSVLMLAA